MKESHRSLLIYIVKCVAAVASIYSLSRLFRYPDFGWCLISAVLVLSPDANEALSLALSRIRANLIGGVASLLCVLGGFPSAVTIALAYCLAIALCFLFGLMKASRTALAAVTIILLHPVEAHLWDSSLERVTSVALGCVVALVITLAFHRRPRAMTMSGPESA